MQRAQRYVILALDMKKLGLVLDEVKNTKRPKNLHQEFQLYGCTICEQLGDTNHYSLYIKLAKDYDRALLDQAVNFVKDYPYAKSKAKLFMWKLKELRDQKKMLENLKQEISQTKSTPPSS